MAKKYLIFAVMVLVFIAGMLCLLNKTKHNPMKQVVKEKISQPVPEIQHEVRITAVEEKIAPKKKTAENAEKKLKTSKMKVQSAPAPDPEATEKSAVVQQKSEKTRPPVKKPVAKNAEKYAGEKGLAPARYQLSLDMTLEGRRLIDRNAAVPMVQASYGLMGFEGYLSKMLQMGGRLFLGDAATRSILSEIFVEKRSGRYRMLGLECGKRSDLDNMALFRPREIDGETLVDEILDHAGQFYEKADLRCVILLPIDKEAAILGALKQYLNGSGYELSQFDVVWGDYVHSGNQFTLKLHKGRLQENGEVVHLNMTLGM